MVEGDRFDALGPIFRREVTTVKRTPVFAVLVAGLAAIALAIAAAGSGAVSGYVPTVVDLLTPVEVLVPVLGFAFGYRVLLEDRLRGELAVLSTYPLDRSALVGGVYLGRATMLVGGIVVALLPAAFLVAATSGPEVAVFATHSGADSALLYLRFVALTTLYALVVLAVALAVSAVARNTRGAVGLVIVLWLVTAVGFDLGLLAGLTRGFVSVDSLGALQAMSPTAAYRSLVLHTVVGSASTTPAGMASPFVNLAGILVWLLVSLMVTVGTLRVD